MEADNNPAINDQEDQIRDERENDEQPQPISADQPSEAFPSIPYEDVENYWLGFREEMEQQVEGEQRRKGTFTRQRSNSNVVGLCPSSTQKTSSVSMKQCRRCMWLIHVSMTSLGRSWDSRSRRRLTQFSYWRRTRTCWRRT